MNTLILIISITVLAISKNAQARNLELDSNIIFSKANKNQAVWIDNLDPNNLIVAECSRGKLQFDCKIFGVPKHESKLHTCSANFSTTFNYTERLDIESIYRLKGNNLIVFMTEWIPKPDDASYSLDHGNLISANTLRVLDNCTNIKTLSFGRNNTKSSELYKLVIYDDGFDVIFKDSADKNDKIYYQNYDDKGNKICEYPVQTEHVSNVIVQQLVTYGKTRSQGFSFENGYHFFPNGSIIQFADESYKEFRYFKKNIVSDIGDGNFHTICAKIFYGEESKVRCTQYDMAKNSKVFESEVNVNRTTQLGNVVDLQKGILLSTWDESTMTTYVMRPNCSTVVDTVNFPLRAITCRVNSFEEDTGRVSIVYYDDHNIARGNYTLENYAAQL